MADNNAETNKEIIEKIKALPLKERVQAVALFHHLQQKQKLEDELEAKIDALTREYDLKNLPIYAQQSELITGQRAAREEELVKLGNYLNDTEKQQVGELNTAEPLQDFWYKALKTSSILADVCAANEKDWDVLQSVENIELQLDKESSNFTLVFTFKDNEYFTNKVLTKHIEFPKENKQEPVKGTGTHIDWKDGKNITVKKITKKQKNKKTGASRTVTKEAEAESFFNFFKNFDLSAKEDLDEDELEKEETRMNEHFDIATEFVETIIPCSLELYLGLQPELAEMEDGEDYSDEDGEESDEEEEEDKKKKKGKKAADDGKKGEKPECKTQ